MTDHMAPPRQLSNAFANRDSGEVEEAAFLGGFCLLLKRGAAQAAGFLDQRFVWGMEDLDYCLRLRQLGWRLVLARGVFVHHAGSRTIATMASARREETDRSNRRWIRRKWLQAEPWRGDLRGLFEKMPAPWDRSRPKVSVIAIFRGGWAEARACLESVRQSRDPWAYEVLAVDAGESGGLCPRLDAMAEGWPELRVLGPWPHASPARAINRAAVLAQGEHLAVLDAEAVVESGWLERLLAAARSRPESAVRAPSGGGSARGCLFISRRMLYRVGGFDERFAGGLCVADYCLRVLQAGCGLVEAAGALGRAPGRAEPAQAGRGDRDLAFRKWLDSPYGRAEFQDRFWTEAAPPRGLKPVVSIIVTCRGDWGDSLRCLDSIRRCAGEQRYEVLAACLGSRRQASAGLKAMARDWPELRVLGPWGRFPLAQAINRAVALAQGDYLLVLADDVLITPGCVPGLVRAARMETSVGVVAPRVAAGSLEARARAPGRARAVHHVSGRCLLIPRGVVASIGDFDDRFMRDLWAQDYCYRAKQRGYHVFIVDEAAVQRLKPRRLGSAGKGDGEFRREDLRLVFDKWSGHPLFPLWMKR